MTCPPFPSLLPRLPSSWGASLTFTTEDSDERGQKTKETTFTRKTKQRTPARDESWRAGIAHGQGTASEYTKEWKISPLVKSRPPNEKGL